MLVLTIMQYDPLAYPHFLEYEMILESYLNVKSVNEVFMRATAT